LKGTREQRQGIVDSFGASPNDTPLSVSLRPPFAAAVAGQRYNATEKSKETQMAQKVIDIVGTSKESFAKGGGKCGGRSRKDGSGHEVGTGGGIRDGTRWQEDSQIPHHNEDLL
jgi:hypothetical protein